MDAQESAAYDLQQRISREAKNSKHASVRHVRQTALKLIEEHLGSAADITLEEFIIMIPRSRRPKPSISSASSRAVRIQGYCIKCNIFGSETENSVHIYSICYAIQFNCILSICCTHWNITKYRAREKNPVVGVWQGLKEQGGVNLPLYTLYTPFLA
jgi:hypothetical protein